jgi:hypothetical protein
MPPAASSRPILHIHIGAPKTGTSAIQAFLTLNRDAFQAATGIYYPESKTDLRVLKGKPTAGNGAKIGRFLRSRRREGLERAVHLTERELERGVEALLLSSEGFWSVAPETMRAFMQRLETQVSFRFVFYARPQVKHVESAYLQVLGNRGFDGDASVYFDQLKSKFFIGSKLKSLQELAGRGNVTARRYDRKSLVGGDVVDDFLDVFGARWSEAFDRPPEINTSLDSEHYLYARATTAVGMGGAAKQAMWALRDDPVLAPYYAAAAPISGLKVMDAATARLICETFAEDNELLDNLAPGAAFGFNADNDRALKTIEAEAEARPHGLSRLELLLLSRVAQLEATVARLGDGRLLDDADTDED